MSISVPRHLLSRTTNPSLAQDRCSDWTIEVVRRTHSKQVYYVHKEVLAANSKYFAGLFKQCAAGTTMIREQQDNRSRFESLSDEEADVMPKLLDFIYGNKDFSLMDRPDNGSLLIGLWNLGKYLMIPAVENGGLFNAVRGQVSLKGLVSLTYELESVVEDIKPFHEAAVSAILRNVTSIDLLPVDLAAKIHPDVLVLAYRLNSCIPSLNVECILASMEHRRKDLTKDSFEFLGSKVCGRISYRLSSYYKEPDTAGKVAMRLLLLSVDIYGENSSLELSEVQFRCVVIVTNPPRDGQVRQSPPKRRGLMYLSNRRTLDLDSRNILARLPKNLLVAIIAQTAVKNPDTCGVLQASLKL